MRTRTPAIPAATRPGCGSEALCQALEIRAGASVRKASKATEKVLGVPLLSASDTIQANPSTPRRTTSVVMDNRFIRFLIPAMWHLRTCAPTPHDRKTARSVPKHKHRAITRAYLDTGSDRCKEFRRSASLACHILCANFPHSIGPGQDTRGNPNRASIHTRSYTRPTGRDARCKEFRQSLAGW